MVTYVDIGRIFVAIINTLIVSIPEEAYLMSFCLILMNRFDVLEFEKAYNRININSKKLIKFLIPVTISAALSNILRSSGINQNIIFLVAIPAIFIPIVITYRIRDIWEIAKALILTMIGFLIMMLIEASYVPLISYGLNKTIHELNSSLFLNFIFSVPERAIECYIITYLAVKKFNYLKISVIKTIVNSKALTRITVVILGLNIAFLFVVGKLFYVDRILTSFSLQVQVLVNIVAVIFPILNLAGLWAIIYSIKCKEQFDITLSRDRLSVLTDALVYFYDKGKYDKVEVAINDIKNSIDKLKEIV